jgi:hypothetical protein
MNLELVEQLYNLQSDPSVTPAQQAEAKQQIAAIADEVVEGYLASFVHDADGSGAFMYRKKGTRVYENYQHLWARNCLEGPIIAEDGKTETSPPPEDKVGNVLFHRKYSRQNQ